jgi:hypothetical protein
MRDVTKQGDKFVPCDPLHVTARGRANWKKPTQPYAGWRVDHDLEEHNLWPTFINVGKKGAPTEFWDAPGFFPPGKNPKSALPAKNHGREFITCAIGWNKGKEPIYLGSVRWGFFVDSDLKVSFEPSKPTIDSKPPPELGIALSRWNFYTEENSIGKLTEGVHTLKKLRGIDIPKEPK